MKIHEALFLSSIGKAFTIRCRGRASAIYDYREYHVQVDTLRQAYASDPAYAVTVALIIDEKIRAPHKTEYMHSIDELETYLQTWIDLRDWEPLEETDECAKDFTD